MADLDPLELGDELMAVVIALRRVVRRRLGQGDFDPPLRGAQVELLRTVQKEPGIGVLAPARSLRLATNSVSTLVNQLVEKGMLRREVDPDDRRAVRLSLTDAAARRLEAW